MRPRHAVWFMALWSLLMTATSVSFDAQDTNYLAHLNELNLATLSGKVPAFYVNGYREHAELLQRRIEDCNTFFQQRMGVEAEVTLAVLDADGWRAATGSAYGLPYVGGKPPVIFMPATSGSPAFHLMMARKKDIPEDVLQAFLAERHTTFETIADQFVDLIGFHELGHMLTTNYGIDPTNKWLSEFLASYWSYAYISERQPDWKSVFDLMGRPSAVRPKNTSLEDFERLYAGVDDYGWYQGTFEARVQEIYPKLGLNFLTDLKREFPLSTSTTARPAMTPQQLLQRLERVAPGFEAWSARFNADSPVQAMAAKYDDLQWQTIIPELGPNSPQISILRVDPATRATQLLIRVPKQIHVPMHWHSANETHTVIRGNWTFEHEGMREQLGPGGFNYIPARMHHQAWASDDALVFITVDAAWDINWVSGPPTKADLGKTPDAR